MTTTSQRMRRKKSSEKKNLNVGEYGPRESWALVPQKDCGFSTEEEDYKCFAEQALWGSGMKNKWVGRRKGNIIHLFTRYHILCLFLPLIVSVVTGSLWSTEQELNDTNNVVTASSGLFIWLPPAKLSVRGLSFWHFKLFLLFSVSQFKMVKVSERQLMNLNDVVASCRLIGYCF